MTSLKILASPALEFSSADDLPGEGHQAQISPEPEAAQLEPTATIYSVPSSSLTAALSCRVSSGSSFTEASSGLISGLSGWSRRQFSASHLGGVKLISQPVSHLTVQLGSIITDIGVLSLSLLLLLLGLSFYCFPLTS